MAFYEWCKRKLWPQNHYDISAHTQNGTTATESSAQNNNNRTGDNHDDNDDDEDNGVLMIKATAIVTTAPTKCINYTRSPRHLCIFKLQIFVCTSRSTFCLLRVHLATRAAAVCHGMVFELFEVTSQMTTKFTAWNILLNNWASAKKKQNHWRSQRSPHPWTVSAKQKRNISFV